MRYIKILVFIITVSQISYAQNASYIDDLDADFEKAYEYYYSSKDSCYFYFNRIKTTATANQDIPYLLEALLRESWSANFHNDLPIIKKNLRQLDSIERNNKGVIDTLYLRNYYKTSIQYTKGLYEYDLNNYKNALKYFNQFVKTIEDNPDYLEDPEVLKLYLSTTSFIGNLYVKEGKYKLATDFYEKNLRTIRQNDDIGIGFSNNIQILLADIYQKEGQYEKANSSILKVLDYYISITKNNNRVITSYQRVVENHLKLGQSDSARFYLAKMKPFISEKHPLSKIYLASSAQINKALNNYSAAEKDLEHVIGYLIAKNKPLPDEELAQAYQEIGLLHMYFRQPKKALSSYELAIHKIADPSKSTLSQTIYLQILKNKLEALNSLGSYQESLETTQLALDVLDNLKPSFKNNSDKMFLMEDAFPVFESALEASFNLFDQTQEDSLIDKAFYYSEKSKSVLLTEALLGMQATEFANIPKNITEKEQLLKSRITYLEKQLNNSPNDELASELFDVKKTYRELISTIETNYKTYFNLKYNAQVISLKEVQNLLDSNTALVSYFYGNKAIYSITITNNSKSINQVNHHDALEKNINSVYSMLKNPKSNLEDLNNQSFQLYSYLAEPSIKNLNEENIIIITDGLLNYIPFSSLSVNGASKYLIQNHAISYVNSATLFKQLSEKEVMNTKVLAFAPSFTDSKSSKLLALPHNRTEAEDILKYFNGKTLTDNDATLQNFNLESTNYGVLHFATHAILDDENPEYSYLAFQPKENGSSLLYVSDLYNLNLNTSLVTLSACESGIGDLKRGEGFISLARGFYFSGVTSISSTLWKINDASSLNIMEGFYKNLSEGLNKSQALQQSQISFIKDNSQNALSHPYYWSGFVISGNTKAMVTSNNWIWYVVGFTGLIVVGYIIRKRRKSS
ncbi:CHAT domain-containing protein [Bizionia myxarmorum]|uniref:CHAT domain-containing protein n=1 Tax=Bizionia myxarmorum TaxID=291186 RepID=A0A5D0RF50_9FLAO|nr:CHAT domain-containing protein [Bizionia myxarmorum]TYB79395.1 CHAT domain-containing protein [Bizionia myxarmorum]